LIDFARLKAVSSDKRSRSEKYASALVNKRIRERSREIAPEEYIDVQLYM
jgi:hypothetical protein